jgi:hypothetical protein
VVVHPVLFLEKESTDVLYHKKAEELKAQGGDEVDES